MKDYEQTFAMMAALDATFPSQQADREQRRKQTEDLIASGKAAVRDANQLLQQMQNEKTEALRKLREAGFNYLYGDEISVIGTKLLSDLFAVFYDMDKLVESKDSMEEAEWDAQAAMVFEKLAEELNRVRNFNRIVPFESQIRPI